MEIREPVQLGTVFGIATDEHKIHRRLILFLICKQKMLFFIAR